MVILAFVVDYLQTIAEVPLEIQPLLGISELNS